MLLRGRGPEEQLLPDWRVGRCPHSSALFNGAAHEYCMTPAVGLRRSGAVPGRAEPWCRAGAEPSAPAARGAFTLMRTMQSAARPPSVQPDLSGGGGRRCYDNSGKVHGVEDLSKLPIRTFFCFFSLFIQLKNTFDHFSEFKRFYKVSLCLGPRPPVSL